jgi:hypothetical protein
MTLPPNDLPPSVFPAFESLGEEQRTAFASRYDSAKRSMALMMALSILFPVQLFFLGKVLLGIIFLITGGGFGIWYVVEWFLTPGRVRDYNAEVAGDILSSLGAAPTARDGEG